MTEARPAPRTALWIGLEEQAPALAAAYAELDPAAAARLPLHITVLFPFVARTDATPQLRGLLSDLAAQRTPVAFELHRVEAFTGIAAYAAPDPVEPISTLIREAASRFPDTPPYGGAFGGDPVPHATLCKLTGDEARDAELLASVHARVVPLLPVRCRLDSISLAEEYEPDCWRELERFPFGQAAGST